MYNPTDQQHAAPPPPATAAFPAWAAYPTEGPPHTGTAAAHPTAAGAWQQRRPPRAVSAATAAGAAPLAAPALPLLPAPVPDPFSQQQPNTWHTFNRTSSISNSKGTSGGLWGDDEGDAAAQAEEQQQLQPPQQQQQQQGMWQQGRRPQQQTASQLLTSQQHPHHNQQQHQQHLAGSLCDTQQEEQQHAWEAAGDGWSDSQPEDEQEQEHDLGGDWEQQQQQQHWEQQQWGGFSDAGEDLQQRQWQQRQQQQRGQVAAAAAGEEEGEGYEEGDYEGSEGYEGTQGEEEGEEEQQADEVSLESADDLSREDIIARIEQLAADLIASAAAGQLPSLTCISTAASNTHLAPRHSLAVRSSTQAFGGAGNSQGSVGAAGSTQGFRGVSNTQGVAGTDSEGYADADPADADNAAAAAAGDESDDEDGGSDQGHVVLRLGSKVATKSLMAGNGAQAQSVVRALQLLDSVHKLLREGRSSTQRDIYYSLVGRPGFERPRDVSSAVQSVLGMLRVPRAALGISAASKGAAAGCLLLRPRPGEPWVDLRSVGPSGRPIPGEVGALEAMSFRSAGARCILVVEKDAVFQSLVQSRLHEQMPCILITGRGMPDVASRAFLAAVVQASRSWGSTPATAAAAAAATASAGGATAFTAATAPATAGLPLSQRTLSQRVMSQGLLQPLPVLGLVDWNPGGVSILAAYKFGAAALGLESARYAVPSLSWVGVTSSMLQEANTPESRCHPLSNWDTSLLGSLEAKLSAAAPAWLPELAEMRASGLKADIEALEHAELLRQLQKRVLTGDWL